MQLLFLLWLVIEDHDNLFIMAEVVHFLGIGVLIYKLQTKKNAGGESAGKFAYRCMQPLDHSAFSTSSCSPPCI